MVTGCRNPFLEDLRLLLELLSLYVLVLYS